MKACLNCQKEYENKRESSKFCCTNCRVKWNQKQPKNNGAVSKVQLQALYSATMEALGEMRRVVPVSPEIAVAGLNQANPGQFTSIHQSIPKVTLEAIKRKYVEERREITCDEDYLAWVDKLESDNRLSTKDKELVKNTH